MRRSSRGGDRAAAHPLPVIQLNRTALLEPIFCTATVRSRRFGSPTLLSAMFLSATFCRRFALNLPLWALCGGFFRPCIELVWHARPAYSADRCAALLNGGKAAIVAAVPVGGAPFVGIGGCSRTGNQEQRYRRRSRRRQIAGVLIRNGRAE